MLKLYGEVDLLKARTVQELACHQEAFDSLTGLVVCVQIVYFVVLDEASGQEQKTQKLQSSANAQVAVKTFEVL